MSRGKKSDTATTADWSFLDWPGVATGLTNLANDMAMGWEMDSDGAADLLSEVQLALAVRPKAIKRDFERGGARWVLRTARSIMRDRVQTEKGRRDRTEYLDPGHEEGE